MEFKIADLKNDFKILIQAKEDSILYLKDNIDNISNIDKYLKDEIKKVDNLD
jgi:hypothetical protein